MADATTQEASIFGDAFTTSKKLIKSKIENVTPQRALSHTEYVMAMNKRTTCMTNPKFGLKGYPVADSKLKDKIYQIPKIVKYIEGKTKDSYLDHAVKAK